MGGMRSFHSPGLDKGEPTTEFLDDNEPRVYEAKDWNDPRGFSYSYLVDYETEEITAWSKY
jgi:hypothetical protein